MAKAMHRAYDRGYNNAELSKVLHSNDLYMIASLIGVFRDLAKETSDEYERGEYESLTVQLVIKLEEEVLKQLGPNNA